MSVTLFRTLLAASLLVASVLSASAQSERAARVAHAAHSRAGAGRFHALVIGNEAYEKLPRLKTAAADARAVEALLRDAYGFETRLLLDATRRQIVSAIYSYRRALGGEDSLLIYYAGHGLSDPEEEKAYWLPVDAARDDPSNWIIADEITTRIKAMPARHVLVVSDSCYSGTLDRGIGDSMPSPDEREQFLRRMMAGRSRTLMASGGDEPVSDGGGGSHSVFASALLRGLREMERDGFTAAELFRGHVEEAVAGRARQTPEYQALRSSGHESGDFVFVRVKPGGERAAATRAAATPVDAAALESDHWKAIEIGGGPEEYAGYLRKYPAGQFAEAARRRAEGEPRAGGASVGAETTTAAADVKRAESSVADAKSVEASAKTREANAASGARGSSAEAATQPSPQPAPPAQQRGVDEGERVRQPQPARDADRQAGRGDSARGNRP